MPEYRAYHLNSAGHIIGRTDLVHDTDIEAILESRARYAGVRFEVWQGARLVYSSEADSSAIGV
jgi:hypothetical protein